MNESAKVCASAGRGPRSAFSHYNEEVRALKNLIRAGGGGGDAGTASSSTEESSSSSSGSSADRRYTSSSTGAALRRPRRTRPRPRPRTRPCHRRGVWRLHGKHHQEATVQMVRWIQEQMGCAAPAAPAPAPRGQCDSGVAEASTSDSAAARQLAGSLAALPARAPEQPENHLQVQVASPPQRAQAEHQLRVLQLLDEQARLRKALALKNAIFRCFVSECRGRLPPGVGALAALAEPPSSAPADACQIPTLVS
ncbi:IgG receptor FcRn large subunit p51 [Frankliniella fusca]|uniref:IgG receptor FcRn large subunit p51 n=1 Tax=Frankliniella fusca TaxID=407009 RepID=A0AAE1H4M6_9NEOP|nr:IgG receptor FcRn large subunit p51 [Frankliniella fusca]